MEGDDCINRACSEIGLGRWRDLISLTHQPAQTEWTNVYFYQHCLFQHQHWQKLYDVMPKVGNSSVNQDCLLWWLFVDVWQLIKVGKIPDWKLLQWWGCWEEGGQGLHLVCQTITMRKSLHTHVFFRSAPAHVKDKDWPDAQLKWESNGQRSNYDNEERVEKRNTCTIQLSTCEQWKVKDKDCFHQREEKKGAWNLKFGFLNKHITETMTNAIRKLKC